MTKAKTTYFPDAMDWDKQRRLSIIRRGIRNKRVAWGNGVIAAIAVGTVAVLLPLKTFIPVVIRVDTLSGAYDVSTGWAQIDMGDAKMERTKLADLGRYISAREGFTRGEAEKNYKTAYLMSCDSERGAYDAYIKPESNPASPIRTMGPTDQERVDVQNITFLPTDREDLQVAQVRFDKTTIRGTSAPTVQRYISTVSFNYRKSNVPTEIADMQFNAFGFCASQYRRDPEGPARLLKPDAAGNLAPVPAAQSLVQTVEPSNAAGAR